MPENDTGAAVPDNDSSTGEDDGTAEEDKAAGSGADGDAQILAAPGENGSDGVYIVEEGDTLAIISRKMYGDVSHVDAICRNERHHRRESDLCGTEIAITVKPWYNDCTLCNPKRILRFALLRRDSTGIYGLERKCRCAALPFLRT